MKNLQSRSNHLGWNVTPTIHSISSLDQMRKASQDQNLSSQSHEDQRFFISPGWGALGYGWGAGGGYPYWGHHHHYYRQNERNVSHSSHPGMIYQATKMGYSPFYGHKKHYGNHGHHGYYHHQGHHGGKMRPHWGYWNPNWGK